MNLPGKDIVGLLAGSVALLAVLTGCTPEPVANRFDASGHLIALSGGDAGAEGACHTCHGLDGEGDGNLSPRLAGLESGYLVRQLDFFADGQRQHGKMSWIADHLSSAQRMMVSQYYAEMEWRPRLSQPKVQLTCEAYEAVRLYHEGDPSRGLASCASCHGEEGRGVGPGNPAIAGQPAPYVATQLEYWRTGKRYGDARGLMREAARGLAAAEINPLADYISRMTGQSRRPVSPEECLPPRRPDPRSDA